MNFLKKWYADRLNFMDTNFLAKPVFSNNTGAIPPGSTLSLTVAAGATIYYTTNGIDPRVSGGGFLPDALAYTSPIALNTNVTILARAYNPNHFNLTGANNPPLSSPWSGLASESFVVAAAPVITQSPANLNAYLGQNPRSRCWPVAVRRQPINGNLTAPISSARPIRNSRFHRSKPTKPEFTRSS